MTYRFVRRLADGGFSEVFCVEDSASALSERLVLKRLTGEMSARREVREAFASEAEILRELRHANIVTFRRCYFDEEGRVCLLMEEVSGEPLDAWARRHAGNPDEVLEVFEQVLRAVDYLHHRPQPYLHLDLKPDNILVTAAGGRPKPMLIDFGIARRSGRPGLRAYTPPYAAPEQESGRRLDEATDVHALGQILAELLTTIDLPAGVGDALAGVAQRARSRSRSARFTDAGQMGLSYRQARRLEPAAAPRASRPPLAAVPRWLLAAAGAAALTLGLVVVGSRGPSQGLLEQEPEGGTTDARVQRFIADARRATHNGRFDDADGAYSQAKQLASQIEDEVAARGLAHELERLRQEIDLARRGMWVGGGARLVLQEVP
jgi:eukaryotic-like serine/threonine-protein kinase